MRAGLAAVALVALLHAACHDEDDQEEPHRVPAANLAAPLLAEEVPTPIGCFEEAGLANPERSGPGLWRATEPGAGTLVIVQEKPSPAHARQAERQATDPAESVGPYFVHGRVLYPSHGSPAAVAACLRGD
jgi:hypothetical protein